MIPIKMFFSKGVGYHKNKLQSFEMALRNAGVQAFNLVNVSSIFPPHCRIVPREEGLKYLKPGQVVYAVLARNATSEPNRLVSAAIGLARPKDTNEYGYLSEHHAFGENLKKTSDFAEDLAASMLATTMGIELDPDLAWDERKEVYKVNEKCNFSSRSMAQTAEGHKYGLWTTVVAMAVFISHDKYYDSNRKIHLAQENHVCQQPEENRNKSE